MLWDRTLSQTTSMSNRLRMSLQRQHFLLSYLKTLRVGPNGIWRCNLTLSRRALTRRRPHCIQENSFNTWVTTILEGSFTEHTWPSAFHSVLFHVKLKRLFSRQELISPVPPIQCWEIKQRITTDLKYLIIFSNIAPGAGGIEVKTKVKTSNLPNSFVYDCS